MKYIKRDKLMPKRGTLSNQKAKKLIKYKPSWPIIKVINNILTGIKPNSTT